RLGHSGLTVDRRDVVHDVDPLHRAVDGGAVPQITGGRFDARAGQVGRCSRGACERTHRVSRRREVTGQVTAGKPGGAGYEDSHRSATRVTGEPSSGSSPTAPSARSTCRVKAADPMALWNAIGSTNCRWRARTRKPAAD